MALGPLLGAPVLERVIRIVDREQCQGGIPHRELAQVGHHRVVVVIVVHGEESEVRCRDKGAKHDAEGFPEQARKR